MSQNRYQRQLLLDKIGKEGQQKLAASHICIIGCGGLGAIAAPYLAGAGIGKLTLVDGDKPDISNLHRQVLYNPKMQRTKAEELTEKLREFNPDIHIEAIPHMVSKENIIELIEDTDLVLECTDRIEIKYLINDACALSGKPMIYGAVHKYDGYVSTFLNSSEEDTHLRDIFPDDNIEVPSCSEVGVLNTIAGLIGILQANEAIKVITGIGKPLTNQLLVYDILENKQMTLKVKKCFEADLMTLWESKSYATAVSCEVDEITLTQLFDHPTSYKLISILEEYEHEDIIDGTSWAPLSSFDIKSWQPDNDQIDVYYCQTGKRSGQLVTRIKQLHKDAQVLSLQGGLKGVKKMLNGLG